VRISGKPKNLVVTLPFLSVGYLPAQLFKWSRLFWATAAMLKESNKTATIAIRLFLFI
jgi:hypothetical protein